MSPLQPSITLKEQYGPSSQRWLRLHADLIVAGHGGVDAIVLDELDQHGVIINDSASVAVLSLCGAAVVIGTLSLLVHSSCPPT